MIMGDGKTTVIAPLLSLLLADGKTLVVSCVPAALLDMSRSVMIERFSSPVMPKPVITLSFTRLSPASKDFQRRLEAAVQSRAVVVATPTSLKSVLLKMVELVIQLDASRQSRQAESTGTGAWFGWMTGGSRTHRQEQLSPEEEVAKMEETHTCGQVLRMFHEGAVLLDEVDLLLDPLRSELNWPMGRKRPLDLTDGGDGPKAHLRQGLRNRLPFHLFDGVFAASGQPMAVPYSDRSEAKATLKELAQVIVRGKQELKIQSIPHVVILSQEFYRTHMLGHLADWLCLLLEAHLEGCLNVTELKAFLRKPEEPDDAAAQKLRRAPDLMVKLLNLAVDWLHRLLPHILSKVHRVSYGLLGPEHISATTPKSRILLAVPFVGKDRPSDQAEFSHPDVATGFTIMAYRISGMRLADLRICLSVLQGEMRQEASVRHHRRAACLAYVSMATRAGSEVRGFTRDGRWIEDLSEAERWQGRRPSRGLAVGPGSPLDERRASAGSTEGGAAAHAGRPSVDATEGAGEIESLWPLELVDLQDPEQVQTIYRVLHHEPLAIQFFLDHHVFLPHTGTLDVHEFQLTACGQELAGKQLGGMCLGFSGTPNDLLPRSMGECVYTAGVDAQVLGCLSSPDVVSVCTMSSWTPTGILDYIAQARADNGRSPKYHALIDVGALITGMSNLEAAGYLLRSGLQGLEGVVFLNSAGERMVLVRDGFKVIDLAQCGLANHQRFTFYDHVHTTGMDIKQPLACTACLTFSKDTSLRDYSQGAYRMRGIGRGQRIELLLIPEVVSLMHKALGSAEGVAPSDRAAQVEALRAGDDPQPRGWVLRVLVDVVAWVQLNGMRMEAKRHVLLCQQNLRNLWRSSASDWLEDAPADEAEFRCWLADESTGAPPPVQDLPHFMCAPPANALPARTVCRKLIGRREVQIIPRMRRVLAMTERVASGSAAGYARLIKEAHGRPVSRGGLVAADVPTGHVSRHRWALGSLDREWAADGPEPHAPSLLETPCALAWCPGLGAEDYPGASAEECPAHQPDLCDSRTLLGKVLQQDPYLVDRLRDRRTSRGVGLARCIKPGLDHRASAIAGAVAGDAECYRTFRELFDPLVGMCHPAAAAAAAPEAEAPAPADHIFRLPIDPRGSHALSVRVEASRNLEHFRFPTACDRAERIEVERILVRALSHLSDADLRGQYYPLRGSGSHAPSPGGMSPEDESSLAERGLLFKAPESPERLSSGVGRHWPEARGAFVADSGQLVAWCNEEDHLKVVSLQQGGDLRAAYGRFACAVGHLDGQWKSGYRFARSAKFGYLTACPCSLGVRGSVVLRLPLLASRPGFGELCARVALQARWGQGPYGVVELSSPNQLAPDIDNMNSLIVGCSRLVRLEEALESGADAPRAPLVYAMLPGLGLAEPPGFPTGQAPEAMPDLSENATMVASVLTKAPGLWSKLKGLRTGRGMTFAKCIKPGMDCPQLKIMGVCAGDEESYDTFADIIGKVMELRHAAFTLGRAQPSRVLHSRVSDAQVDPGGGHAVSVRVQVSRNLSWFRFPTLCSAVERHEVERLLVQALGRLQDFEARGEYFPLPHSHTQHTRPDGMSAEEAQELRSCAVLLAAPSAPHVLAAGSGRQWPEARGVFAAASRRLAAWVNGEDWTTCC
ncbi:unnamed protein product [Prorocentrum cordatum]|uniref:RNA-directed RNA polymerase n=1 Tax=Prorocentrum cordatum TaxID=2364126 RepID=A0ABN9Y2D8_9DINO|nr:unnamed protein product [Polarella glacialis]